MTLCYRDTSAKSEGIFNSYVMEHDSGLSEAYTIIDPGLYHKNYILLDTDSGIDIF